MAPPFPLGKLEHQVSLRHISWCHIPWRRIPLLSLCGNIRRPHGHDGGVAAALTSRRRVLDAGRPRVLGAHRAAHPKVELLLEAKDHFLEHLVDIEDAAGGLPELLNDPQHEHVCACEAPEEDRLEREDPLRRVASAEQWEGEQLHRREQVEQTDSQEGELALHCAEPVSARLP